MATTTARRKTTTEKGLGWRHQQAVDGLFRALPPVGDPRNPCDWCGRLRYADRTRNWDYNPEATNPLSGKLQGDHSTMARSKAIRLGLPIPLPDRLLHQTCNIQRGDGGNDHLAWSNTGRAPDLDVGDEQATSQLLMPWPW